MGYERAQYGYCTSGNIGIAGSVRTAAGGARGSV